MHCKNIVLKTSKTLFETAIIDSESALINVLAVVNSRSPKCAKSSSIAFADLYVRSHRKCQHFYVFSRKSYLN